MIPLSDENPTLRTPWATYFLLAVMGAVWFGVEGAGLNPLALARAVCDWGMVPGELTHLARLGTAVPLGRGLMCVVDDEAQNILTPLTSMFLHGGWAHLLGNALFFWIFGNNIEDSMGKRRFLGFYLLCGLVAAASQVVMDPASPVPMVGASGAISGVLGAYLVLYPSVRVRVFFPPFFLFRLPAWLVLLEWFGLQVLEGLPQLLGAGSRVASGVAVWAHIGGFLAGMFLVKLFENPARVRERSLALRRLRANG